MRPKCQSTHHPREGVHESVCWFYDLHDRRTRGRLTAKKGYPWEASSGGPAEIPVVGVLDPAGQRRFSRLPRAPGGEERWLSLGESVARCAAADRARDELAERVL